MIRKIEPIQVFPDKNGKCIVCFIGKEFYSPKRFIREAENIGFSRLVNKIFPLGSPVLFAYKHSKTKNKAFAIGHIEGYLFPDWFLKELEKEGIIYEEIPSLYSIERRDCGTIHINCSVSFRVDFNKVIEVGNKLLAKFRREGKPVKIFMRGRLVRGEMIDEYFSKPVDLIADFARFPYAVRIISAPDWLKGFLEPEYLDRYFEEKHLSHNQDLYKLNR